MPCDRHIDAYYPIHDCRDCAEIDALPELVNTTTCRIHGLSKPCAGCAYRRSLITP